jgi:molybdopterin converting factor small subunit
MAIVQIPLQLKKLVDHQEKITIPGGCVSDILMELVKKHPALQPYIFDKDNNICHFINVYLNGQDIRFLAKLNTTIQDNDTLAIIPAVAGG